VKVNLPIKQFTKYLLTFEKIAFKQSLNIAEKMFIFENVTKQLLEEKNSDKKYNLLKLLKYSVGFHYSYTKNKRIYKQFLEYISLIQNYYFSFVFDIATK
jgi:hypothetical protein